MAKLEVVKTDNLSDGAGVEPLLFSYPQLPPAIKSRWEKTIRSKIYDLKVAELGHLLETPFPFSHLERLWLERYLELAAFWQRHGHVQVSMDMPPLWRWVIHQRRKRREKRLESGQERALNRLKFIWDLQNNQWEQNFQAYRAYQKAGGKPTGPLRSWLVRMRQDWDRLSSRQRRLLKNEGFILSPNDHRWARQVRQLTAHIARRGNRKGLATSLVNFIQYVRRAQREGRLANDRQKQFEQLGIKWSKPNPLDPAYSSIWEMRLAQAKAYVDRGNNVSLAHWEPPPLPRWVNHQKNCWHRLSEKQKSQLTHLGLQPGVARDRAWERRYEKAQQLFLRLGRFQREKYRRADRTVERWLRAQVERWEQLSPDKQTKIVRLGVSAPRWTRKN